MLGGAVDAEAVVESFAGIVKSSNYKPKLFKILLFHESGN